MQHIPQPFPDDREEAAVEVLRRIYQCKFGVDILDDEMHLACADKEIAAFIRKFGPFVEPPPSV